MGMRVDGLIQLKGDNERTPVCNMVMDARGGLVQGVADMDAPANLLAKEVMFMLVGPDCR